MQPSNQHNTSTPQHNNTMDQAAQAAASLQLLLREDSGLQQFGLTEQQASPGQTDAVAFPYAASLLTVNTNTHTTTTHSSSSSSSPQQRALAAVDDVQRKLALVESLAVKLSRTSPEAVAGHLLQLHGFHLATTATTTTATTAETSTQLTLAQIRERAVRLERQAESVEATARRVETQLQRGLSKLQMATTQLQRSLLVSSVLKTVLLLQFETTKLQSYDLDDWRDLIRAAASVAVLEELWTSPELSLNVSSSSSSSSQQHTHPIAIVEGLRPTAMATAQQVRQAAAQLLAEQNQQSYDNKNDYASLQQLGAVLQVYFHLHELPQAVWQSVDRAHAAAERVSRQLWNPVTLQNLYDQVQQQQRSSSSSNTKAANNKAWKQVRTQAAREWTAGVLDAAQQVRTLHQVLRRKTDPVTRTVFLDVVAQAPVPPQYILPNKNGETTAATTFSLVGLFWNRFCQTTLAVILQNALEQDRGNLKDEMAALYPAVRAAAIEMVYELQESGSSSMRMPLAMTDGSDSSVLGSGMGVLGGSAALEDPFLDWHVAKSASTAATSENPQSAGSANSWTTVVATNHMLGNHSHRDISTSQRMSERYLAAQSGGSTSSNSGIHLSAVLHSAEWKTLEGREPKGGGLFRLEQAFLSACRDRLTEPLKYMFPENIAVDDDGIPIPSGSALLPSKYDVQRFDENIRQELSTADPREGGDLSAVTMISDCVVQMTSEFCGRAKNAMSGVGEHGYLEKNNWSMTDSLQHDRKVVAILYTLKNYLQTAPEKTFVAPYRPAVLPQNTEAATLCAESLQRACTAIDQTVNLVVLTPLCRALNRRIAAVLAKMHYGVYTSGNNTGSRSGEIDRPMEEDASGPSFVQKELTSVFEMIAEKHLAKFPPVYASVIASNVMAYTVYNFVSNASLVRPLSESARLLITQDLTELERILDQFVAKTGSTVTLPVIGGGKPYGELRAVRQMLFWSGLDQNATKSADDVAKSLMREVWLKELRPSTIFHFLFSYGPSLLSSPYHVKRLSASEYVHTLVPLDGTVAAGGGPEDASWMTIMSCCDSYQQRVSAGAVASGGVDGDARVAQIVLTLGNELLRRRGRN